MSIPVGHVVTHMRQSTQSPRGSGAARMSRDTIASGGGTLARFFAPRGSPRFGS